MQPIKKTIIELQHAKPAIRGTTLITYIVPGSMDMSLITKHLTTEISTASNIKSKHVRSAVTDSLKSLMGSFQNYCRNNKTPSNGLVMLAGSLIAPLAQTIPYYL
jgi:peptide subunit release factor 1 (eRF1)